MGWIGDTIGWIGDKVSGYLNTDTDSDPKESVFDLSIAAWMKAMTRRKARIYILAMNTQQVGISYTGPVASALNFNLTGSINAIPSLITGGHKVTSVLDETLSAIQQVMILPNFMGIPLFSPQETVTRRVDVSENQTIVQSNKNREYHADNATPHLREWSYDCYLKTPPLLAALDTGLLVKPTLVLQEALLDSMAKSRQPGWLKTSNSRFQRVQITNLKFEHTNNVLNAVHCLISFREYDPLNMAQDVSLIQSLDKSATNQEEPA